VTWLAYDPMKSIELYVKSPVCKFRWRCGWTNYMRNYQTSELPVGMEWITRGYVKLTYSSGRLISRSQSGAEWKSNSYPPLSALRHWIGNRWILNHSVNASLREWIHIQET
jgi:hypothetical protein